MERVRVKNATIRYALLRSRNAHALRLRASPKGTFLLTVPLGTRQEHIRRFLRERAEWMLEQQGFFRRFGRRALFQFGREHYLRHREEARTLVERRLRHFLRLYRVRYRAVRVKNHAATWGSCSELKNLNFSYKLLFLPRRLSDYIIVHELCHLKHFDHSPRFWRLVARTFPDYRDLEWQLRYKY
ncbi:M48 family metallopeptidase [Patescibacteria group bacterium]|nr:M48 family metallopeptidase [Patescibacteria group bacterium]